MRQVKRWRYYCDFCKKAGGSSWHMAKHEKGCTLNPKRDCRHCEMLSGGSPTELADLIAMLPDPAKFTIKHEALPETELDDEIPAIETPDDDALREAVHAVLPKLREATENCPTCIMAALRQRGIPVPVVTDFKYAEELKETWRAINDARAYDRGYSWTLVASSLNTEESSMTDSLKTPSEQEGRLR